MFYLYDQLRPCGTEIIVSRVRQCLRAFLCRPHLFLMVTVYRRIVTEVWKISKRKMKRTGEILRKIKTILIISSLILRNQDGILFPVMADAI